MNFKCNNPGCCDGGTAEDECSDFCNPGETIDDMNAEILGIDGENCTTDNCVTQDTLYVLAKVAACKWEWNGSGGFLWIGGVCVTANLKLEAWMETQVGKEWRLRFRLTNLNGSDSQWVEWFADANTGVGADDCCTWLDFDLGSPLTLNYLQQGATGAASASQASFPCDYSSSTVDITCDGPLAA